MFKRGAFLFVLLVVIISLVELVGWSFDIAILKYPVSGAAAINPLVAVNFILFSIDVLSINQKQLKRQNKNGP